MSGAASKPVPSIRARLANALTGWAVVWGLAVGAAVWWAASREVDELLDDALQSSAELLAVLVTQAGPAGARAAPLPGATTGAFERFAWQVVAADGTVPMRSPRAPDRPWSATRQAGFSDTGQWRLFGLALPADGRMLYAAQTRAERDEARAEAALSAVLAALAVGLLGHVWLRLRVRAELQPLLALSGRLEALDFERDGLQTVGPPARLELQPVHRALDSLMLRLAARMATEQAFSAHAAHALRTPLAGIDAQLAVALRDAPPALGLRLQRVRDAASRLQRVVAALLGLFRTGHTPERRAVDLAGLLSRLPVAGLQVQVPPGAQLQVDADLLAAALSNLLDNASRHGAKQVTVELTPQGHLRLRDDGPGIDATRRARLQAALDTQAYDGSTGLGLMLADRVARAHGGRVQLQASERGFVVDIDFGAAGLPGRLGQA